MQKTVFKEIKINLPADIAETTSSKEIIRFLLGKALSKAKYYS